MPLARRPVSRFGNARPGRGEQQGRPLARGKGGASLIEGGLGQGQSVAVGIETNAQGPQVGGQGLLGPGRPIEDHALGGGETRRGHPGGDVAHREQQIHLAARGQVETDLEIRFAHIAQQVGPVGQARPLPKVESQHLLHRRQQLPAGGGLWGAGDLNLGLEAGGHSGDRRQGLQLGRDPARYQDQHAHGGRRDVIETCLDCMDQPC